MWLSEMIDKNMPSKKTLTSGELEYKTLKAELDNLLMLQKGLKCKFDLAISDEDIKICVFEMEALETRINCCIKKAKVLTLVKPQIDIPVPIMGAAIGASL